MRANTRALERSAIVRAQSQTQVARLMLCTIEPRVADSLSLCLCDRLSISSRLRLARARSTSARLLYSFAYQLHPSIQQRTCAFVSRSRSVENTMRMHTKAHRVVVARCHRCVAAAAAAASLCKHRTHTHALAQHSCVACTQ